LTFLTKHCCSIFSMVVKVRAKNQKKNWKEE